MLFKTLSASVYGIDAYLVEVEVDVGSADIEPKHLSQAIRYRTLDRSYWAWGDQDNDVGWRYAETLPRRVTWS